jgi:restriction system protein
MGQIDVRTPNLDRIVIGKLQAKYSVDGTRILRYFADFRHKDLNLHKELSAPELYILQGKVDALMASWDEKFTEHQKRSAIAAGKDAADQMTVEASLRLESLSQILAHTIEVDDRVDWESLKDRSLFQENPRFPDRAPVRHSKSKPEYSKPHLTFLDTLLGRKARKLAEAKEKFEQETRAWLKEDERHEALFVRQTNDWNIRKAAFVTQYAARKQAFLDEQAEKNAKIDRLVHGVSTGEPQSVIEHATMVLEKSDYGDVFEKSFQIDYVATEKTLLIEYELPSPDNMPTLKAVRFVISTGEIRETHISEREQKANFDSVCYQICLRTVHELLESDEVKNIDRVLFNGFATYIDRTTGQDTRACIMSVLVKREDFEAIDLSRIDPKACFKSLKGVSASSLSALAPIPPVMELNKEDRRFIEARTIAHGLSDATNLASMDWGDFEHLVRELFEKEFASRGGEVNITQASSDGGVDAVAFDPDPITGGKIVIQAKRYTRTVGVAAVRDLYGTMQHEGASRGILITTADYGPDAYSFASGKPITLFTGANLLHLLEKHGYKAKIDLHEARKELNLRN